MLLAVIVAAGFLLRWFGLHWAQGYRAGSIGAEIEAYKVGPNAFEYKGSNGFMITVDISSKDVAAAKAN